MTDTAYAENLSHQVSVQRVNPTWFVDHVLAPNRRQFWRRIQCDGNQVFSVTLKKSLLPVKNRNSLIFL